MKKMKYAFMVAGIAASLQATSDLEEAVITSDSDAVGHCLTKLVSQDMPQQDKKKIFDGAYQASLDVIQELDDTTEVWNSWSDWIKVNVGIFAVPFLLSGLYERSVPKTVVSGLCCYLGVRGLQCKAQQGKFEDPREIKEQLEKVLHTFETN